MGKAESFAERWLEIELRREALEREMERLLRERERNRR